MMKAGFTDSQKRQTSLPAIQTLGQTPQIWSKKCLQIETEAKQMRDIRDLRQTRQTLNQTPKNKRSTQATDFQFMKFLGNGKFGSVYLVRHAETGFVFAMKIINKCQVQAETVEETAKMISQLISQIKIQMFLNHPNLIKLYTFFSDEYKIYLVMELAPDGQLYELMKDGAKFSEESTSFLMRQTLLGVTYMHERHIIHRDIKPENIVLVHGIPKICDFGWSVHCPKQFRSTLCGTPLYLSPEILKGDMYNQKIDTWAIGTLTYELLTGENPFHITRKSQMTKIITEQFTMRTGSTRSRDFLSCSLQKQPEKRLTAKMMLEHPFIRNYAELDTAQEVCRRISKRVHVMVKEMLRGKCR